MNHNIASGRIAEVGIDTVAAAQCLDLLASINSDTDVQLWPADAGVWNNVVLEAVTPQSSYYFKKYREFADIPNYSPPHIPTEQRAQAAQIAQSAAAESFAYGYRLVPAVLAKDSTAFVMEAIPQASHLLEHLSSGACPESVATVLPVALAKFHNNARSSNFDGTALDDTRFRDYKLDLQYNGVARHLDMSRGKLIRDFAEWYKQQRLCVVHGDLNSKNVLLAPDETVYVIDFEQAHLGSPAYDLAYIVAELFIAQNQHKQNPAFQNLSKRFVERYLETLNVSDAAQAEKEATLHLAAQIIYRFKGPSHKVWTSYVDDATEHEVLSRAREYIALNPAPISTIFDI